MAALITEGHPNHEIEYYFSVQERLKKEISLSRKHIPVKMKSALGTTLSKLFNSPATSISTYHGYGRSVIADISLTVDGEDAGTFGHPDVEKILKKCQPSPFGKGDKTVMDLDYRNGKEIAARDITIGYKAYSHLFYDLIQDEVSYSLFGGKSVELKLYKLAVYEKDGHFDWHRDTTHGDGHHATVLVALNTEWKGGNLGLRYQGTTVDVDLHPVMIAEKKVDDDDVDVDNEDEDEDEDEGKRSKPGGSQTGDEPSRSMLHFQIIAFYTDIEHKVEKITEGTRIVLQFDVNLEDGKDDKDGEHEDEEDEDEEDEDGEDEEGELGGYQSTVETLKPLFPVSGTNDVILKELIAMIKKRHASNSVNEVVFPLRHLYRMASIKPEYLKGTDGYLYEGLKKTFDVSLKPIILIRQTDFEGRWTFDSTSGIPFVSEHETESESKRPEKRRKVELKSEIHLPASTPYELRVIGRQEYIEHTGNEAQIGEGRYFGGGMFIAEKI